MKNSKNFAQAVVLAVVLGGVVVQGTRGVSPLYGAILVFGALCITIGIYLGLALMSGRRSMILGEVIVGAITFGLGLRGVWHAPTLIGVAFLFHALWDIFHHYRRKVTMPAAYPVFCWVIDVILGVFILFWF